MIVRFCCNLFVLVVICFVIFECVWVVFLVVLRVLFVVLVVVLSFGWVGEEIEVEKILFDLIGERIVDGRS